MPLLPVPPVMIATFFSSLFMRMLFLLALYNLYNEAKLHEMLPHNVTLYLKVIALFTPFGRCWRPFPSHVSLSRRTHRTGASGDKPELEMRAAKKFEPLNNHDMEYKMRRRHSATSMRRSFALALRLLLWLELSRDRGKPIRFMRWILVETVLHSVR